MLPSKSTRADGNQDVSERHCFHNLELCTAAWESSASISVVNTTHSFSRQSASHTTAIYLGTNSCLFSWQLSISSGGEIQKCYRKTAAPCTTLFTFKAQKKSLHFIEVANWLEDGQAEVLKGVLAPYKMWISTRTYSVRLSSIRGWFSHLRDWCQSCLFKHLGPGTENPINCQ